MTFHGLIYRATPQRLLNIYKIQRCGMSQKEKPCDMIRTADPVSNLHHIKYAIYENETALQTELRKHKEELQKWNEIFWTKHNLNFMKQKLEFEKSELSKKKSDNQILTPDELSVFYKKFLDENWEMHLKYLVEWYKKTIFVTLLHFRVKLENLYRRR